VSALRLGIDVGGTKTALALVDTDQGGIVAATTLATNAREGAQQLLERLRAPVEQLRASVAEPVAVGVGLPELVAPDGEVLSDVVVPGLSGDLVAAWTDLGVVQVEADVRAAARAEARFGHGRGRASFAYVSVGTGISSCLVIEGVPWTGERGAAILLGSGILVAAAADGERTSSLEEYAGGPALLRQFRSRGGAAETAEELLALAEEDPDARHLVTAAGNALGRGIAALVDLLDPQAVVVGGGLGTAPGRYWHAAVDATRAGIWADACRDLPVLQAATGARAGVIGAALPR
jgi:glucokinase